MCTDAQPTDSNRQAAAGRGWLQVCVPHRPVKPQTPRQPQTLLIGTDELLAAWARHAARAPHVVPLACTDVDRAVDIIELTDAAVIVVEQAVAASGSGSLLMARVHNERSWRGTEIRLLAAEHAARIIAEGPGQAAADDWLVGLSHPLPPRPQRRAPRYRVSGGGQALVDGHEVTLVDVSATGAQVYSSAILRPQRRVRVALTRAETSIRTTGVVVWSSFEVTPRIGYRAGIAFANPIPDAVAVCGDAAMAQSLS